MVGHYVCHNELISNSFVYLILLLSKCPSEVGDVVGVADSTIRQSYRLLFPSKEKLFPTDFKFATPLDQLPNH